MRITRATVTGPSGKVYQSIKTELSHADKPPSAAAIKFAELYALDIRENPRAYKADLQTRDMRAWALNICDGMDDAVVRQMTRDLRAERRRIAAMS